MPIRRVEIGLEPWDVIAKVNIFVSSRCGWQAGGKAHQFLTLLGGLIGANLVLALDQLPADSGRILVLLHLLLGALVLRLWVTGCSDTINTPGLDRKLAIAACLALLSPLSHLYLGGDTHQFVVVVITLVSLPFAVAASPNLLPIPIGCAVCWWLVSQMVATPTEAASSNLAVAVAAVVSLAHWIWMSKQERDQLEETELREREERHRSRQQARSGERERIAVEASCNGYWYMDLVPEEIQFSASWARMLGHEVGELGTGKEAWFSRVHPYYLPALQEALSAHLYGETETFQSQYRIQHRDGSYLWVMNRGVALRDAEGTPIAIAGSQIDITQLVDVEQSIVDEAYRDRLTGLANREAFRIRLEQAVAHVKKGELECLAVMFLDLDRFKVVNDSLGHLVGDELLAAVSSRVRNCTRQARGDLVARFGGDEFVVLIEQLATGEEALVVARRIVKAMEDPFILGKNEIRTGVSIGIALWEPGIKRSEDLLRNADTAMYHAKSAGRGRIEFFNSNMHAAARRLNQLQTDLAKVIERQELILHYQPILSASTGKITAAEALVRWRHSNGEMVGPGEFIPVAEETGLIESIGEWVLRTACLQSVEWQRDGLNALKVSVNVSPQQLLNDSFPGLVEQILAESGLDPRLLELELTETALMANVESAARTIEDLVEIGVSIALDDFGTGYSSLEHLRSFKFHTLKMDRSFVAALTTDKQAAAVARGLINLAHGAAIGGYR